MRLPKLGDIVLYKAGTIQVPAMITRVNMNESGISADSVNLKVFTDGPGFPLYSKAVKEGNASHQWIWPDMQE